MINEHVESLFVPNCICLITFALAEPDSRIRLSGPFMFDVVKLIRRKQEIASNSWRGRVLLRELRSLAHYSCLGVSHGALPRLESTIGSQLPLACMNTSGACTRQLA
eukprot:4761906-Pleurochrysis_carterae.AAC.16